MTHVLPDRVAFVPPLRPVMVANPLQILGADFVVIPHVVPAHSLWLGVHFRGWPVGQYPWGRVLAGPETLLGRPVVITPDVSDNGAHVVCFMFSSPFLQLNTIFPHLFILKITFPEFFLKNETLNIHFIATSAKIECSVGNHVRCFFFLVTVLQPCVNTRTGSLNTSLIR